MLFGVVDRLVQLRQVYTLQLESAKYQAWALVQTANSTLPDTLVIEWVTRQTNSLLAKFAQTGSGYSSHADSLLLEQIAAMCPLEGGNGVYLARSIRNSFRYTIPNDHQVCKSRGMAYKKDRSLAVPESSNYPSGKNRFCIRWL